MKSQNLFALVIIAVFIKGHDGTIVTSCEYIKLLYN